MLRFMCPPLGRIAPNAAYILVLGVYLRSDLTRRPIISRGTARRKNCCAGLLSCVVIPSGASNLALACGLRSASARSQKFVGEFSPRSGRQPVAHGASRGFARPTLSPVPSPARAGEGCRRRGEGYPTQGLRPGLRYGAPDGAAYISLSFRALRCHPERSEGSRSGRSG